MNNQPNKLLNGYQNFQNVIFQNNMLLQNNPMFMNNQMQMQKIKDMQQIKQIEKLNDMEMDKEKIKESVIKPIKIERSKKDKQEFETKWKESERKYKNGKEFGSEIQEYWKKRTNEPYKVIIKDPNFNKRQYNTTNDLIIHRVTNKDKEGVEESFNDVKNKLEKHNEELKVIYSLSNKAEHSKKFEYNHKYKYRMNYDPKNHDSLKQDKIKYYKEQQKKEEEGKQKLDGILETLISDGIFDKEELNEISINVKENNNDQDDSKNEKKEKYLSKQKSTV